MIVIRILWVFPAAYLPRLIFKKLCGAILIPSWRHVTIIGWTGMRGVVSLAAALAIPLRSKTANLFPDRDLILFLTFIVILATLVVQGLSLPLLIRWLGVKDDGSMEKEEREARLKANQAALARLNEIGEREPAKADALQRLRVEYEDHIRQVEGAEPKMPARRSGFFPPNMNGSRTKRCKWSAGRFCNFAMKTSSAMKSCAASSGTLIWPKRGCSIISDGAAN